MIQSLKGFRDFYPEQMAFQSWFYQNLKEVSESFGFQEYEGPTLETLDLYAAKSGDELVKKQAFTLQDKSGQTLALRTEMTPTLARMVAQKENSLIFPLKWFTYGRRFRYEQPQKGRGREFFQWDVDILGSNSLQTDAEVITIAATFYKKLGLSPSEVKIKINDREYLKQKFSSLDISSELFLPLLKIIDKKSKVTDQVFLDMLAELKLSAPTIDKLIAVLSDKNGYKNSSWLTEIINIVNKSGLGDYVEFDPSIVRGLDYYTRTVFEGWAVQGQFRSIWGGGRYDNLTQQVGSIKPIPGVGFAMGDMVMSEILLATGKYPTLQTLKTKILVTIFSPELFDKSLETGTKLRQANIPTEVYPDTQTKLEKQLKYCNRKSIPYAVIIGPEENAQNIVVLKNMQTGDQDKMNIDEVLKKLESKI